jgi:AcrR family transcriptional regulator
MDKRALILEAATNTFLQEGFDSSMDEIATRAGVSKQTIYNHFRSKEALFSGIIETRCSELRSPMVGQEDVNRLGVDGFLVQFAENYMHRLLSDSTISLYRLVLAEASQFPSLARMFYEEVLENATTQLERYFERINKNGSLHIASPRLAADQFCGMVKNQLITRLLLGIDGKPEEEVIHQMAKRAVEVFLHGQAKLKYWAHM